MGRTTVEPQLSCSERVARAAPRGVHLSERRLSKKRAARAVGSRKGKEGLIDGGREGARDGGSKGGREEGREEGRELY